MRRLIEIGALFGLQESAMRVAIARLLADKLLESAGRGCYRMGAAALPLGAHVEGWREGEARMRAWDGGWLAVALGLAPDRKLRRATLRALSRLGMREGMPGLWLRPDNLAGGAEDAFAQLADLGLEHGAESFVCRDLSPGLTARLLSEAWPLTALRREQERALRALERSRVKLQTMSRDAALVETYLVGGEAIRVLVHDPLLPESILPGDIRRALTERMLAYDAIGHRLWDEAASCSDLKLMAQDHAG